MGRASLVIVKLGVEIYELGILSIVVCLLMRFLKSGNGDIYIF